MQMLLDPMGGIVMTNDGNAILREVIMNPTQLVKQNVLYLLNFNIMFSLICGIQIQVQHPAAKSMIEISRTQDEEVGDGTTSVIILGEDHC